MYVMYMPLCAACECDDGGMMYSLAI